MEKLSALLLLLLIAGAGAVQAAPPPCDCDQAWSQPANEDTAVPTNAKLFVSWPGARADRFALFVADTPADALSIALDPAGDGADQWFVFPATGLEPDTLYALEAERASGSTYGIRFTTAAGPDLEAPALTAASLAGGSLQGDCAAHTAAVLSPVGLADQPAGTSKVLLRVDIAEPGAPQQAQTIWLHPGRTIFGGAPDGCLSSFPTAQADRGYTATVSAVDLAGNSSPTTEALPFAFRKNGGGGGGCGLRGAGIGAILPLGLWALVTLWRRRRRRP